jgi:uncharacterized protein (DUF885 family)
MKNHNPGKENKMAFNRREFLSSAALASCAPLLTGTAAVAAPAGDAQINALFDRLSEALLADSPETATGLALDKGKRADLKAMLSDASWAHVSRDHVFCADWLVKLKAVPDAGLSPDAALNKAVTEYALELGRDGGRFAFGLNTLNSAMNEDSSPYVVSQQGGSFVTVVEFLDSQHSIETKADAAAYLSRMEAFAGELDQETDRMRRDAVQGVLLPDFLAKTALGQQEIFLKVPAARQRVVASLVTRAKAKGLRDYAQQATKITADKILPAVARQAAALKEVAAKASHDAGVWKLKDGQAYYAWLLKVGTTTTMTADEVHKMGLEQNAQLEARMDMLLKKQGLSRGTAGERMTALSHDPKFLFPETDAGREQIIAYLNQLIAAARSQMPKLSALKLKAPVLVKRVPPDIQGGAPLGYMNPGSLDGSRPSIYYINLKDTSSWPRYLLPTLTHHEGIPGHAWQGAYLTETGKMPLIRILLSGFNAYVEGWALYAEQLTDEIGMYADDPFGELGWLAEQKMRAGRLVVDTGLHAKRWTRERAIDWFQQCTGSPRAGLTSEVDRYCGWPGQACGYKVGHTEMVRLRQRMKTALGSQFDLRDYNDTVVKAGAVPLTVLARVIDARIAAAKR